MKKTVLFFFLAMLPIASNAADEDSVMNTFGELNRLVAPKSQSRVYYWCAVASTHLGYSDMFGLFLGKAFNESTDEHAKSMALSYMMGFFESEILNMSGRDGKEAAINGIKLVYADSCLSLVLPK